jgi:hypothetical protein
LQIKIPDKTKSISDLCNPLLQDEDPSPCVIDTCTQTDAPLDISTRGVQATPHCISVGTQTERMNTRRIRKKLVSVEIQTGVPLSSIASPEGEEAASSVLLITYELSLQMSQ